MFTARKKKIEHTKTLERVRRACGEVWTQLADAYHWLRQEHDIELSQGDATALFATGGMTKRVKEAWESIPVDLDPERFDRNPFVTPLMRGAGVQQRQQVVNRFYDAYDVFFESLEAACILHGRSRTSRTWIACSRIRSVPVECVPAGMVHLVAADEVFCFARYG